MDTVGLELADGIGCEEVTRKSGQMLSDSDCTWAGGSSLMITADDEADIVSAPALRLIATVCGMHA